MQEQSGDGRVENVVFFENIGYAALEGGKNPDKPYLFIAAFNQKTFDTLPVDCISGRMPRDGSEILVPAHVAANGGVQISVGDTITLAVGSRQAGDETLGQHDPYTYGEETLVPRTEKTYTVVGICQRPVFEERSAPGYTLITASEGEEGLETDSFSAFVTLKKPGKIRSYTGQYGKTHAYVLNDDVLRFMGLSGNRIFNVLLYSIGGVLLVLIMTGSVFLIYNSFSISLNERIHQFGILMSVGATEKQLQNSVLFEGICIGIAGIPMGILTGILGIRLVLQLVEKNFTNVLYGNVPLTLKVSVPAIAAAVSVSMVTILISAYIPARKAARTSVMECTRQTNEIKVEQKAVRISKFTRRIYGLEGTLALKNFKRSRRRCRSILLSLTLSVVLFVSASSFVINLNQVSGQEKELTDYDIGVNTKDMDDREMLALWDKLKNAEGVTGSSCQAVMKCVCRIPSQSLSEAYREGAGDSFGEEAVTLSAKIQFLDDDTYLRIIKDQGLPAGEYTGENAKLPAVAKLEDSSGDAGSVSQLKDMFASTSLKVTVIPQRGKEADMEQGQEAEITCVQTAPPDTPPYNAASGEESASEGAYFFWIMAPWSAKDKYVSSDGAGEVQVRGLTFQAENPSRTVSGMRRIIEGEGITSGYDLYNVHEMMDTNRNILFIVSLFSVVFITMISLIAVANVFNTVSTNIRLRRREFAMLRSVGMSDRDFNKMMRFECLLYGLYTLLYGLPLAGIFSWLIYKGMAFGAEGITFALPWSSMAASILGVFLVIFITMLYAAGRIRKENIIDALRDEMT